MLRLAKKVSQIFRVGADRKNAAQAPAIHGGGLFPLPPPLEPASHYESEEEYYRSFLPPAPVQSKPRSVPPAPLPSPNSMTTAATPPAAVAGSSAPRAPQNWGQVAWLQGDDGDDIFVPIYDDDDGVANYSSGEPHMFQPYPNTSYATHLDAAGPASQQLRWEPMVAPPPTPPADVQHLPGSHNLLLSTTPTRPPAGKRSGVSTQAKPARWPLFAPGSSSTPGGTTPEEEEQGRETVAVAVAAAVSKEDEKECAICAFSKPQLEFPLESVSDACNHTPDACLECLRRHIRMTFEGKTWHARVITCPQCDAALEYQEVQAYADAATFQRYESRVIADTYAQIPGFVACSHAPCPGGQIHESGDSQPIVRCVVCTRKTCFRHRVPWHETLTCAEYDDFLADPGSFRSRYELDNAEIDRRDEAERRRLRELEEADQAFARGLLDAESRAEAEAAAAREAAARAEEERKEKARREGEERRAREERERVANEARRKKEEEAASKATIGRTTKPCPGPNCSWPIEKNDGCAHMTCIQCKHEFCYDCLADYRAIIRGDNSAHKETCPFHPSNLKD